MDEPPELGMESRREAGLLVAFLVEEPLVEGRQWEEQESLRKVLSRLFGVRLRPRHVSAN